ncbi:hypothetical protein FRC10_010287 [Ceratobasidium sp. 414]|nr:hypothetical protein FRC10_010287 [Ceratobasidium sp. 414]
MPQDKQTSVVNSNHGMSRDNPDVEEGLLAEEYFFHVPGTRNDLRGTGFTRVLTSFAFFVHGAAVPIDVPALAATGWSGAEVVGVVGTIFGKEGLFGQCGWFSNYDLDWFWVRLTNIAKVEVRCDPRFRRGDACIWMSTQHGDYAMLLPHKDYTDKWEDTIFSLGAGAPTARFTQLPAKGPRPTWWPDRWREHWPFPEETRLKPVSSNEIENSGEPDEPTAFTQVPHVKWRRLGPAGDERRSTGYASNLTQLDPWHIEPDSGMLPTRRALSTSSKGKHSADRPFADKSSTKRGRGRPRKR